MKKQIVNKFSVGDQVNFWTWTKKGIPSGNGEIYASQYYPGQGKYKGYWVYFIKGHSGFIAETHVEKTND